MLQTLSGLLNKGIYHMGIIKKLFGKNKEKSTDDLKAAVLKKATENWNAKSEQENIEGSFVNEGFISPSDTQQIKKNYALIVLQEVAEKGEAGVLSNSISDKLGINKIDTATALTYLTNENYIEAVNSQTGMKYYITEVGRKYSS